MTGRGYLYAVAAHVGFILFWQLMVIVADVPSYILPSPLETISEITDSSYNWWTHTWAPSSHSIPGCILKIRFRYISRFG